MNRPLKWISTSLMIFIAIGNLSTQSKPNIVVILADDLGYGSANCCGAPLSIIRNIYTAEI